MNKPIKALPPFIKNCLQCLLMTVLLMGATGTVQAAGDNDSVAGMQPAWPTPPQPPQGAPNIVIVLLDDVGFGAAGTFGGPVATPALDQLAEQGLRYNRFHTAAVCSPTRAALLTGINHHRVGFGTVSGNEAGFPGYNGLWRDSAASVARVLQQHGYSTAAFGKWHNTPNWEISAVGPFEHWPTGLGFDYFYGFMGGQASQWEPMLFRNTTPIEPPATAAEGYHFTTDIVDQAVTWKNTQQSIAPDRPYFLYLAPGATHAPHHVPPEWIARYRGRFEQGWDQLRQDIFERQKKLGVIPADTQLTPRPEGLPAWNSLSDQQRHVLSRQMEVYAAFLAHTDYEVGRLLESMQRGPDADNTLVLYIVGDNGGSAEGGLMGSEADIAEFFMGVPAQPLMQQVAHAGKLGGKQFDNNYSVAWAWAMSTPFQWVKQVASHFGATRNPMVLSWPARVRQPGGLRHRFTHVVDVVPTLYELIGIEAPVSVDGVTQQLMDGLSFADTVTSTSDDPDGQVIPRVQYFEALGNRAIYQDGWMASARHGLPWQGFDQRGDIDKDEWELYYVAEDFSQAINVADRHPEKLEALQQLFDQEARRNQVYPLGARLEAMSLEQAPSLNRGRHRFVYQGSFGRLPTVVAPILLGSHRITADITMPVNRGEGVIVANGGRLGGYAFYIQGRRLVYEHNFFGRGHQRIISTERVPDGALQVAFQFERTSPSPWGGGVGRLLINDKVVAEKPLTGLGMPYPFDSFDIGRDRHSPVADNYQAPFAFNGTIQQVVVEQIMNPATQ